MSKKIQITESQLERLMKTITEVASGYDDHYTMYLHGGKSLEVLIDTLRDLVLIFTGINSMLMSDNIEYADLKENFKSARNLIGEISKIMSVVFRDFTDRRVIKKGKILLRTLESYQERIKTTFSFNPDDLFEDNQLKERLIMLTASLANKLEDYALELQSSAASFKEIVQKGRDKRNPNMN